MIANPGEPVIRTEALSKTYRIGANVVRALRDVDLEVRPGEMLAVMGPSGSGKSTLMNLLGCLDFPTSGTYRLDGEAVESLNRDRLADLRNRRIGFVFQGFHLLGRTSALENVELPLLYDRAGRFPDPRARAREALRRVGLSDREDHDPTELSGGQQQRVAIARALVTEPALLLADEPTGNLDSRTSVEVMALLQSLNRSGMTLLVVTHEEEVAAYASRVISLLDGIVVRDEPVRDRRDAVRDLADLESKVLFRVALRSIARHKLRTVLTMLGLVIGVSAVLVMVAVGEGARSRIREQIDDLGTNLVVITPGASTAGGVSRGAGSFNRLSPEDAEAIADQAVTVSAVSPVLTTFTQAIGGDGNWRTLVFGVSADYLDVRAWPVESGRFFDRSELRASKKVVVLGKTVAEALWPGQDPIGAQIQLRRAPFEVIGVLAAKGQTAEGQDQDDCVVAPWTTIQNRLHGRKFVSQILASTWSPADIPDARTEIAAILRETHALAEWEEDDFVVRDQTDLADAAQSTTEVMTILLASIAGISLLVGGIGIMNIMLVSVTERTREIGIRMSLGARGIDVLRQFLVESIVISLLGGAVGVALGFGAAAILGGITGWSTSVTPTTVVLALGFSAGVGVFFGFYPARRAARLNPIDALRHE